MSNRNSKGVLRTENFKRPDHNDFKDSSELRKERFSGVRNNSISHEWEIWVEGERKAFGPASDVNAFAAAYEEVFALKNVEIVSLSS